MIGKTETTAPDHSVWAAKLIVSDLEKTRTFYEEMFGMQIATHYDYAPEVYEEYIMAFERGARLALFSPNPRLEKPLRKSVYPQALIMVEQFEDITQQIKRAGHRLHFLTPREATERKIAIAYDPSGNVIEIFYAKGPSEVGSSKLIVDDRQKAEAFYLELFGPRIGERYVTSDYDEVILHFNKGASLALLQPMNEEPLDKSAFPLIAIVTSDFDAVLARLDALGFGYRDVDTRGSDLRIVVARDPAGNQIEIISN